MTSSEVCRDANSYYSVRIKLTLHIGMMGAPDALPLVDSYGYFRITQYAPPFRVIRI